MAGAFYFNLKEAVGYTAVELEKLSFVRITSFLKKLFYFLFFISLIASIFLFLLKFGYEKLQVGYLPPKNLPVKVLGVSLIVFPFWIIFLTLNAFFDYLKNPETKISLAKLLEGSEKGNLADFFSFEVLKVITEAVNLAKRKKISLNSSVLFYFILADPKLDFVFFRTLLDKKEIKTLLEGHIEIQAKNSKAENMINNFETTILDALAIANKKNHKKVDIGDLLIATARNDLVFKKILINTKLKIEDIENLVWWLEEIEKREQERKKWWDWKNLAKIGSVGKEFAAGYTITLDKFSVDLTKEVLRLGYPEIIGHQTEIEQMERILARREACNDPLIVGEAGSGRKSMVLAIAKKSLLGESLPEVNYKRIVQLNLEALIAHLTTLEDVEATLDVIFREVMAAGNVILVIDELHNYIGTKTIRPGAIDISGVLASFIASPYFQIIGITTFEGLHRNIEQNPSMLAFFEKVEVSEISTEETLKLMQRLALKLEKKYKILISYPSLRDVIYYCEKYLPATPFPEKALDLLEEAVVHVAQKRKERIILPKHVAYVVTQKTQVPVGEVESGEKEVLLNLEKLFHEKIINQEEAVKEISAALRRARTEIQVRKGPIGSFLFLGPTGVGKTETAKALAEIYFGSEKRMIRLDMSEFQNPTDIPRLLGSPGEEGLLTTPVRENPFALILLDEFEKAYPQILNLFLQVFDEGHLTDGLGRKVDFKNTIIICTSNAGYQLIFKAAKENRNWDQVKEELIHFLIEEGMFRPELLNRFDAVVLYKPLTKENLLAISDLLLRKIQKQLKTKEIDFIITEPLKEKIVDLSYTPQFGARQMQRVIQDKISNLLAEAILRGKIKRGDRIKIEAIEASNFSIIKS